MSHPPFSWNGSVSLALYLSDSETEQLSSFVRGSPVLRSRRDVGYHVVYREGGTEPYPVNALRNVALEAVRTPFAFLSDADFIPGGSWPDAHAAFAKAAGQILLRNKGGKKVMRVLKSYYLKTYACKYCFFILY